MKEIQTNVLTLGEGVPDTPGFIPAVRLGLATNNVKPMYSQKARLMIQFQRDFPAEIEVEPGEDCQEPNGSSIISEVMLWGRRREGRGRNRVTLQINREPNGDEYALLDSTTNDPSGDPGQGDAMPLLINRGEARGIYIGLYPGNTLLIQNRATGRELRIPIEKLMEVLG